MDFSPDNLIHIDCRKCRKFRCAKEHTSTYGLITQRQPSLYISSLVLCMGRGKRKRYVVIHVSLFVLNSGISF